MKTIGEPARRPKPATSKPAAVNVRRVKSAAFALPTDDCPTDIDDENATTKGA